MASFNVSILFKTPPRIYPPRWTVVQKDEMKQHLPIFAQKYPEIINEMDIKKMLDKYFS